MEIGLCKKKIFWIITDNLSEFLCQKLSKIVNKSKIFFSYERHLCTIPLDYLNFAVLHHKLSKMLMLIMEILIKLITV